MDNMINRDRSRRSVIRKMKELGLIHGAKDLARTKTSIKVRPPKEWADHEVVELRRLFEEVRGSSDPLSLLIDRMPIRRAKRRIRDKIVELGLVNDVKELRKKRPSNKKNKSKRPDPLAENNNDEDEDDRILFQDRHRSFDDSDDDSSDSDDNSSDGEGGEAGREPGHGAVRSTNRPYGFMRENVEAFNAEKLAGPLALMMDGGTFCQLMAPLFFFFFFVHFYSLPPHLPIPLSRSLSDLENILKASHVCMCVGLQVVKKDYLGCVNACVKPVRTDLTTAGMRPSRCCPSRSLQLMPWRIIIFWILLPS